MTTSSSSSMRSRSARSPGSVVIVVRRSSPYLSRIAVSSSLMTAAQLRRRRRGSPRARRSSARSSSNSSRSFWRSSCGEPAQRHVEDVRRLHLAELERREPAAPGVAASADSEPRISVMIASIMSSALQQALDDVRAVARLVEPVLAAPGDDLDLVRDVDLERRRAGSAGAARRRRARACSPAKFVCIGVCL